MDLKERFEGCIIGGAIGDMLGSIHENQPAPPASSFYLFPQNSDRPGTSLCITDDTQLTLATCESIIERGEKIPNI